MELLSEEIRKNGFIYRLEKRGEKAMVYRQICPEEGDIVGYEVFKIKVDKPKVVFGKPPTMSIPIRSFNFSVIGKAIA